VHHQAIHVRVLRRRRVDPRIQTILDLRDSSCLPQSKAIYLTCQRQFFSAILARSALVVRRMLVHL
jgi:hypothetical protein